MANEQSRQTAFRYPTKTISERGNRYEMALIYRAKKTTQIELGPGRGLLRVFLRPTWAGKKTKTRRISVPLPPKNKKGKDILTALESWKVPRVGSGLAPGGPRFGSAPGGLLERGAPLVFAKKTYTLEKFTSLGGCRPPCPPLSPWGAGAPQE